MNFAEKIKREIINNGIDLPCCEVACLSAYMKLTGSIIKSNNKLGFEFSTDNEDIINFIVEKLNSVYGTDIIDLDVDDDKLNKKERFTGEFAGENAMDILSDLGVIISDGEGISLSTHIDKYITENNCCKVSYIKGAFLGAGNITLPKDSGAKTGYHLEFVFTSHEMAEDFCELLATKDIFSKLTARKDNFIVYIKSSEEIKDLLALMGLSNCVLELTDLMCEKELSSFVNRQRNCDMGNLNRQINATEKQLKAFNVIEETIGLSALEKPLVDIIEYRRANQEDTLMEMSEALHITKSCLNHRLRKIMEISENLK